jgi:hypothetical protein
MHILVGALAAADRSPDSRNDDRVSCHFCFFWLQPGVLGRTVGSRYTVEASRHDGTLTLHGTPEYAGSAADEATRRTLWTEHTPSQTQLESTRAERDAARRNALDEALAPLLELAAPLRTSAQRDALAAYVIRKLHNAWTTR